ncbi:MAG: MerR family DNA-binding transcriptional regulator [Congregibacter sp.]
MAPIFLYVNVNVSYIWCMMPNEPSFTISELAEEFAISTRTIRFYEEKGYVNPKRDGQKRLFSATDRARIKLILRGKRIGLSLAESIEIIDMYSPDRSDNEQLRKLLGRVREQRDALLRQREDLDATLRELDEVEALCEKARRAGTDKNH